MRRFILLITLILIFNACSDEFDLINDEVNLGEDWKEVFVVNANISPSNELHFIRVNRGFSTENFFEGESEIDSIQYGLGELDVNLHIIENNDTTKSYTCRDTVVKKDSGEYFNTGQVLLQYFKEHDFVSGNLKNVKFGLEVRNGQNIATATTDAIGNLSFEYPPVEPSYLALEFEATRYKLIIKAPANSQVFEVFGVGVYREIIEVSGNKDTIRHDFLFKAGSKLISNPLQTSENFTFLPHCSELYEAIEPHVLKYGDTVNAIRRRFDGVYFKAFAGNSDVAIALLSGDNVGFQDNSNAIGNIMNGLGSFSAYNEERTRLYDVSVETLDSIMVLYGDKYLFSR